MSITIDALVEQLRAGSGEVEEYESEIKSNLSPKSILRAASVARDMAHLGLLDVLGEEDQIWPMLWRRHEYISWRWHVENQFFVESGNSRCAANDFANSICTGILFDDEDFLSWGARALANFFLGPGESPIRWSPEPIAPYVLRLWAASRGVAEQLVAARPRTKFMLSKFNLFNDVFKLWTDEKRFGPALKAVCEAIYSDTALMDPSCVPIVVLATLKVRSRLGLSVPQISHAWLKMSRSKVPPNLHKPKLRKVFEQLRSSSIKCLPALANPPQIPSLEEILGLTPASPSTSPVGESRSSNHTNDRRRTVHLWAGRMTEKRMLKYLEEYDSENDDSPISEFAGDMGMLFYDHDFIRTERQRAKADVVPMLELVEHSGVFLSKATKRYERAGSPPVNTLIAVWDANPRRPKGIEKPGMELFYLGKYHRS